MTQLKSAYELSLERVIKPTYKMHLEEEYDELSELPDFVEAWKHPDGPEEHQSIMLEDDESQSYLDYYGNLNIPDKLKIEVKDVKFKKTKIEKEVIMRDPETIHYGIDVPEVHWYGHFTGYTGFSRMNRAMAFGLSNKGVKVKVDIQESEIQVNQSTLDILRQLEIQNIKDSSPKIFGATIPLNMFHNGKKILYTMMETSVTLHRNYVEKLNLFNEIWVPTHFAKNMFKQNGVLVPIYVIPLGVDIKRYTPERKEYNFGQPLNNFVFLSVFKWGYRKGYDILLKAFLEEFSSQDNVSLLIVSRAEHSNAPDQIVKDFSDIRQSVQKPDDLLPHVALCEDKIPEKDMPRVYGACDAFVLISRGEGFGLPFCEAGASGLPVIASNCSGHSDFLNKNNSFLVDPDLYTKASINGAMSKLAKLCHFYEDQQFPDFGEKGIEKTKKHMRYVFENYDNALSKAELLKEDIENQYTWDHAVEKAYQRILELNRS